MKGIDLMFFNKKNKAMSFAELIIVLAIIGTIASLTLPGLKKYSQRAEFAKEAQKAYTNIEGALDNAILLSGPIRNWNFNDNTAFFNNYLAPNIKHTSVDNGSMITFDGMTMSVSGCNGNICVVDVDVNAEKLPNVSGKDQFKFEILKSEETSRPHSKGVEKLLRENDWRFSDKLWNCSTADKYDGTCTY